LFAATPSRAKARAQALPRPRLDAAQELGELCAFLCGAGAGYITGQSIIIDGGLFNAV